VIVEERGELVDVDCSASFEESRRVPEAIGLSHGLGGLRSLGGLRFGRGAALRCLGKLNSVGTEPKQSKQATMLK